MRTAIRFMLTATLVALSLSAFSKRIKLEVTPSQQVLPSDKTQTVYLKIGLTGFTLDKRHQRPAANIAIVLDRSGSMRGVKILRAKDAAIMALDTLSHRDIASVITYSDGVEVIQPAARISNKPALFAAIRNIYTSGSTALFAGVSKGADEIRRFFDENKINRVILLSDGQANVGPRTPHELGELGQALAREGISVTTIGLGLGYNEDLMTELAARSGGNHAFVESPEQLARIFQSEFSDLMSVVGQDARLRIQVQPGVRPVRVLGRKARIHGQQIDVTINQIHSKQQKYVIVELEVPATGHDRTLPLATVSASYKNAVSKTRETLSDKVVVRFDNSAERAKKSVNNKVMSAATELIAIKKRALAIKLRDQGRALEARKVLRRNSIWLKSKAKQYKSKRLQQFGGLQEKEAQRVMGPEWNKARKQMRKDNYKRSRQQSY